MTAVSLDQTALPGVNFSPPFTLGPSCRKIKATAAMRSYLGIRYVIWALIVWVPVAGTFGVILLYRTLIAYKEQDELFMGPAEIRRTLTHIRHVNRMAALFGAASALSLVLIVAAWSAGLL